MRKTGLLAYRTRSIALSLTTAAWFCSPQVDSLSCTFWGPLGSQEVSAHLGHLLAASGSRPFEHWGSVSKQVAWLQSNVKTSKNIISSSLCLWQCIRWCCFSFWQLYLSFANFCPCANSWSESIATTRRGAISQVQLEWLKKAGL